MFFTSPVGVSIGSKEPVAIDFAILHFALPAVCKAPLFGFHEITSKMGNGGNVLVGGVGGVACQHPNSIGDIGAMSRMRVRHREIYRSMEEMMREEYGT